MRFSLFWLSGFPAIVGPGFLHTSRIANEIAQEVTDGNVAFSAVQIRPFQPADEKAVIALWQLCDLVRPWNNPHRDIQRKLRVRPDLFLVGVLNGEIIASVMAGYEGHRGWLNYLAVAPQFQRRGFARAMIAEAERLLRDAGCPKINLQIRTSNRDVIEFYRRVGYSVDDVVSMGKRLGHDTSP
jgi:ribosomal protein S18 acetylase RimI-like enzyme